MTTARSRLELAVARMDAAIAKLREEAQIDRELPAMPSHHLGCILTADHEGDCIVARGRRRASAMKLPLIGGALVLALAALGCGSAHDPAPTTTTRPAFYHVDSCGGFTGYKALMALHCNAGDVTTDAHCDVDGGAVETSMGVDDHSWECGTTWNDSQAGGTICVHLTCAPPKPIAHRATVSPLDGTHGCDVCELEVPR